VNSIKLSLRSFAALVVAGMLAGCAGGASAPQTSSNGLPFVASQMLATGAPMVCTINHGVSIKPCSIHLSLSHPTQKVTTMGPKGGKFSFNDTKCKQMGIATISGSGNTYTAVWGNKSGSCIAVFTDKNSSNKIIGTAKLSITNKA
jgi:hypothetical protein